MIANAGCPKVKSGVQDKHLRRPSFSILTSEAQCPQSLDDFHFWVIDSIGQFCLDMTGHSDENSQLKATVFNFEYP